MELVERYVNAVGERLHPSRRAKVEAELRSAILDALESRGPEPTEQEVVAVLASMGRPASMAEAYEPGRQFLVGPELYPTFRRVLRGTLTTLTWLAAAGLTGALLLGGFADFKAGSLLVRTLALLLLASVTAGAVQLALFAWLQHNESRPSWAGRTRGAAWDPRSLPVSGDSVRAPLLETIPGLVAAAAVLVVVSGIGWGAREALPQVGPALQPLVRHGVLDNVILLQVGLLLSAGAHLAALVQGKWWPATRGVRLLADAIGVFVFARVPFQLLDHRRALLEGGMEPHVFTWLAVTAGVTAVIMASLVLGFWWRRLRTGEGGGHGGGRALVRSLLLAGVSVGSFFPAACLGSPPHVSPAPPVPDGPSLHHHQYASPRFAETRDLWVYTPPGYDAGAPLRYPTLYLLHGVGEHADAWSRVGGVEQVLDSLIAAGLAEPMVVVMPGGYGFPGAASRAMEMLSPATDQRAVMEAFSGGLQDEVIPMVERLYRVRPSSEARAVAGLSMGGSQAVYLGLNHPDVFARAASFGGAIIMFGGRYADWFPAVARGGAVSPGLRMSVGADDFLLGANRHFVSWLHRQGVDVQLDEVPGGHEWALWRRELIRLLPVLFRGGDGPPAHSGNQLLT